MNLTDVMRDIAARLATIDDSWSVYPYPPGTVSAPAAVVSYPDTYTYDATYGRGSDELTLTVALVAGRVHDDSTRDQLSTWLAGTGDTSVKAGLEADEGNYTAFDSIHVAGVEFDTTTIGSNTHMVALVEVRIAGQGGQ